MLASVKYVDVRVVIGFNCGCQCAVVFDLAGRVQDQDMTWPTICGSTQTHDAVKMYKDASVLAQLEVTRVIPHRGTWR